MERIKRVGKQGLWLLRLALLALAFIAGHIDHWKQDLAYGLLWLSRAQLLLYFALAMGTLAVVAIALACYRDKNLKRWSWLLEITVVLVFVESFVRDLIRFYSEVRTSWLSLGFALTGLALLILAAVLDYRRQKQQKRVVQNGSESPTTPNRDGLDAGYSVK